MELLLSFSADANALGEVSDGLVAAPLFAAAMNGHADVVRVLLAAGADIDGQRTEGALPALVAALPHPAVALLLLSRGASPNLRFPAALLGADDAALQTTPLAWAVRAGDAGLVSLLLEHGADPGMTEVRDAATFLPHLSAQNTGVPLLKLAENLGHSEVARLLRLTQVKAAK